MPGSNKAHFYIDLPLYNVGTSQLNRLLQQDWLYVDIQHRDFEEPSGQWDKELSSTIDGLLAFNYDHHNHPVWQRTIFILHRLLDNGWLIYAGSGDGVLCIILTNSGEKTFDGLVERVQVPLDSTLPSNDNHMF